MMRTTFLRACLVFAALGTSPAWSAKWATMCPAATESLYKQMIGHTTSPFVHPGHEIALRLLPADVAARGGFSVAPGGNRVDMAIQGYGGRQISLPSVRATAVSPSTLYVTVPDTRALLGRTVAGQLRMQVKTGSTIVWMSRQLVALPPANDVSALVRQGADVEVLGTFDYWGSLWIPVGFSGFGPMPKPDCPVVLTPNVAFGVGLILDSRNPDRFPYASVSLLRRTKVFLGDFRVGDFSLYGTKVADALDVRVHGGATICALNDAADLVLMVSLRGTATGDRSTIRAKVQDGSPLRVKLRNVRAGDPKAPELVGITRDSFGNRCAR